MWFVPWLIAAILGIGGIFSVVAVLDALKLVIVLAITLPMLDIFYRYISKVLEGADRNIIIGLSVAFTALTAVVIYQSWGAIVWTIVILGILYVFAKIFLGDISILKL
ncbi:MAG: hypothetical protein DRP16_03370 [Candidatus Aenigmatarchaeota archaeon]|nr:MAG: hypothetical protein DRP16_03370 [Candidatus Aenigmarchaeota archaeon]